MNGFPGILRFSGDICCTYLALDHEIYLGLLINDSNESESQKQGGKRLAHSTCGCGAVVCLISMHRRAVAVRHQEIHKRRLAVWSTTSGFCVIMIITSGLLVSGFILF